MDRATAGRNVSRRCGSLNPGKRPLSLTSQVLDLNKHVFAALDVAYPLNQQVEEIF